MFRILSNDSKTTKKNDQQSMSTKHKQLLLTLFRFIDVGTCQSDYDKNRFHSEPNRNIPSDFHLFSTTKPVRPMPTMFTCQAVTLMNKKYWVGAELFWIPVIAECGCKN